MGLTVQQQGVVNSADGFNMVCALPGSGKTHVSISVTEAILNMSPNYSVGLVSFTAASAIEMATRVKKRIGNGVALPEHKVKCATFHSFVLKQWRDHKPGFVLIMKAKQSNIVVRALNQSDFAGNYEDAMRTIDFYGQMLYPVAMPNDTSNTWGLYQSYCSIMKANKGLDLSMVFRNVILAMRSGELEPLPYTHLLCDEFQDTDNIQYAWLQEHAKKGIKITTVGDDDQSIYGFRNSRGYEVMKQFQEEFDAVPHVLSTCFRCKPEILSAAQKIIEFNVDRVSKDMQASADPGGEVHIYATGCSVDETEYVLRILEEHKGQEFAILARNNRQLDFLEGVLKEKGIEYNRDSKNDFWELPQVEAFLKVLFSLRFPYDTRYINEVLGFIEEDEGEILKLTKLAKRHRGFFIIPEESLMDSRPTTKRLHKIFLQLGGDTEDPEIIRKRMNTLMQLIGEAKGKKDGKGLAVASAVRDILVKYGEGDFHERIDDIIYKLRPQRKKEEGDEEKDVDENPILINLSTLHGSKGLEWPNVILLGLCDGVMPSPKCTSLEEERRLLYVGMTRAEQRLYMLYYGKPSVYLLEAFPTMFPDYDELEQADEELVV